MIFCDTSTVAKLYVPEAESKAVRQRLEAEDGVHASELVRPELMAVFHRRLREGRWTRAEFAAAVRQFSADDIGGFWSWLPLDGTIIEAAAKIYATLPATVFLRTADCLHLVTALHHNFPEIFTHDKHQTAAAAALGVTPVAITP
jgi:predicted nucleic acid-binding protein